jgi:diguanylate cyclase (GGDEF)-like protein
MLDVDHFKSLNDTYGHPAGDEVLQQLATIMNDSLRGSDTAYRYGGEEFAMLLRETSIPDALLVADRFRGAVELSFARWREGRAITVSLGVADIAEAAEPKLLIAAADRALYRAKTEGRNRVVTNSATPSDDRRARGHVRPVD